MATKAKKLAKYSELQEKLSQELPINAARIKFMVLLVISLLKVQSVSFERLAQGFDAAVELSSNLRRIQRFFAGFQLDGDLLAGLLMRLLPLPGPYKLSLDRTNWKFGSRNINILFLGVIYRGMSLPILWTILGDKRGNSDQEERIQLLRRFIRLFGREQIDFLTADREFVGQQWWQFLIAHKVRFFLRIRSNMQVQIPRKGKVKAAWLFNRFALDTPYHYPKIVQIKGCWVYLSGLKFRNRKGRLEFLIIASYQFDPTALESYSLRWQIESMFKAFKSAGFQLEDSHLTDYERINKLLFFVALAYFWAYKTGILREKEQRPLKVKKHGRLEKSIFAYGLEWLAQAFLNALEHLSLKFMRAFLSCT